MVKHSMAGVTIRGRGSWGLDECSAHDVVRSPNHTDARRRLRIWNRKNMCVSPCRLRDLLAPLIYVYNWIMCEQYALDIIGYSAFNHPPFIYITHACTVHTATYLIGGCAYQWSLGVSRFYAFVCPDALHVHHNKVLFHSVFSICAHIMQCRIHVDDHNRISMPLT